ncbi:hypothetical protein O181_124811, partial [Austropuccinia psidii MF-1]|nr:hypothetical protein [Austropuccinia psidii MF-1]
MVVLHQQQIIITEAVMIGQIVEKNLVRKIQVVEVVTDMLMHHDSNKSSYGMSRNSESNTWSSAPVKSSYGTLSSSSGTNNMVISSRPDPWSNSNNSREIETTVWQRPPQPPLE